MFDLLNSKEMQIADKETIDNGTPSILLMERAGKAIFNKIKKYINKEDEVLIIFYQIIINSTFIIKNYCLNEAIIIN